MNIHNDELLPGLPLSDEEDRDILMHREVHFSGSFDAMIEYYSQEDAKGICDTIDRDRIIALSQVEKSYGSNIAPLLLSGRDAEKIARMRTLYSTLTNIAEKSPSSAEGLFAGAMLSEEPIESIVEKAPETLLKKPEILIPFISSDEFADPLSPGYGSVPVLAIELLGKARFKGSIRDLFQCIGTSDETKETAALKALRNIGEDAKLFAMKVLCTRPITRDTERATLVLTEFLPDEKIHKLFQEQLADSSVTGILREYLSV